MISGEEYSKAPRGENDPQHVADALLLPPVTLDFSVEAIS